MNIIKENKNLKSKPVVYIAGFECFLPDGEERAKKALEECRLAGFEGISPALGDPENPPVDFSKGKQEAAKQIFFNNIKSIDRCDLVIANANNFRGWEPDGGTCFELGYAFSQGKKLYCFMDDVRPCYEKYIGRIHRDGPFWRDDNGAFFESGPCNLMISGPAKIAKGGFAEVLRVAARDFGI